MMSNFSKSPPSHSHAQEQVKDLCDRFGRSTISSTIKDKRYSNFRKHRPLQPKKFTWRDPKTGHSFAAGGILFYDDEGVWTVGEMEKGEVVYTDIGGKYTFEDGNIYATISRELREETYGVCEIFAKDIEELCQTYPPVYINGNHAVPVYLCLVLPIPEQTQKLTLLHAPKRPVPVQAPEPKLERVDLDPLLFEQERQKTLRDNPFVPEDFYRTMSLTKIPFDKLASSRLSYRLRRIITNHGW